MFYNGWEIRMTKNRNVAITSEFGDSFVLDKGKDNLTGEELLEILKEFIKERENGIQGN